LLLLSASTSRASPKLFVVLEYRLDQALGGCPSETAFRAMVEGQLGYDPFRSPAALKVVASGRSREEGIGGSIEWYDSSGRPRGERQLSSVHTDCVAFARAMSFAVAVQIQLLAREAEGTAPAAPAPTAAESPHPRDAGATRSNAPPAAGDVREPAPHARPEERAPWRFLIGGGPFVTLGMAPRAAPGARVFAAGRVDWFALELGAEATLPAHYSTNGPTGFDEHVALGSIAGCVIMARWSVCSVSKLGRVYVRGFGVEVPREPSGGVVLTGARLMLDHELSGRWLGALRLESLATLGPWDVTLNQRTVWTMPLASLALGIDIGLLLL
jgi:hypothetical protein